VQDLQFTPAHEIAAAVRRRDLSPVEVMQSTIARLERLNPPLNAFVALRLEDALADARALEARIARGADPGILAGVPFGVKDEEDLAGFPTTHGSVPWRTQVIAHDSTQVGRARAAGAIPLGKTNLPEFGSTAFTKNHLFGTTRNPWNLARTPGGSSGGSSAAVAAGIVPCATGGDGGGSIRIPAAYTGLVGLKATFGRIPRGRFEYRDWTDTISRGPLTRDVRDTALWLDAVVGYDPYDPDSLAHGLLLPGRLDEAPRGLRVAYLPTLGYGHVAADVRRAVEDAALALGRALGTDVETPAVTLTDVGLAWAFINSFQTWGRIAAMVDQHRDDFGRGFLKGCELGTRISAIDIARCQQERYRLNVEVAELFARYDLLVMPTCPTTAFPAGGPMPDTIDGHKLASPIHGAATFTCPFNMTGHAASRCRRASATTGCRSACRSSPSAGTIGGSCVSRARSSRRGRFRPFPRRRKARRERRRHASRAPAGMRRAVRRSRSPRLRARTLDVRGARPCRRGDGRRARRTRRRARRARGIARTQLARVARARLRGLACGRRPRPGLDPLPSARAPARARIG
jgi:aspartyl-tRNA(Asn)/glutamyl-tRNA(Gln) amidotransferase subunit A